MSQNSSACNICSSDFKFVASSPCLSPITFTNLIFSQRDVLVPCLDVVDSLEISILYGRAAYGRSLGLGSPLLDVLSAYLVRLILCRVTLTKMPGILSELPAAQAVRV